MSPICEKPCGKLPTRRFRTGSYSSASSPRSLRTAKRLSNSLAASSKTAEHDIGVGQPEAAGEERAFFAADPIIDLVGRITQHEAVVDKAPLDRLDRADRARVVDRQEANLRDEEEARVQGLAAIILHEAAALGVEAVFADIGVDRVAQLPPAIDRTFQAEVLGGFDRPVERDPAHEAGMGEGVGLSARLPYAVIGLPPDGLQVVEKDPLQAPGFGKRSEVCLARGVKRLHQLAGGIGAPSGPQLHCQFGPACFPHSPEAMAPRFRVASAHRQFHT